MKRNIFFISLLAVLIPAGCSKNEPAVLTQESVSKEIDFSSNLKSDDTKSGPLGQSFRIEAFLSGIPSGKTARDVFFPSTAYRYNSGKYTGDTTRYWPVDAAQNVDFYAVSPLQYRNTSSSDVELVPAADSSIVISGTDGTTDIVAARRLNVVNGTNPVSLTFEHLLTKVSFSAIGKDQTRKYVITDLLLTANSSATYRFGASGSWGTASGDTTKYAYDYVSSDVTIPVNTSTAIPVGEAKCLLPSQAAKLKAVVKYKILDSSDSVLEDNTSDGIEVTLSSEDWIAEKQINYTLKLDFKTPIEPEHVFTVAAGKQVKFTKGNLYWNGSDWKMEANQYDFRHYAGKTNDAAVINGVSTTTPSGTVGSFYWNNDQTKACAGSYTANPSGADDYFFCGEGHELTVDGQSGLYALSSAEWTYLLSSTDDGGRGDGDNKFKYGVTVDSKGNCLIIAPDDYAGTIASSYTAAEWTAAESAGLVCLPAAGYRSGSDVYFVGDIGYYWSSTPDDSGLAYNLDFDGSIVYPANYNYRYVGQSVRLVCSAQ